MLIVGIGQLFPCYVSLYTYGFARKGHDSDFFVPGGINGIPGPVGDRCVISADYR